MKKHLFTLKAIIKYIQFQLLAHVFIKYIQDPNEEVHYMGSLAVKT